MPPCLLLLARQAIYRKREKTHIDEALPKAGNCAKQAGDEYSPTPSKPIVEGRGQPTSDERTTHIRGAIDEARQPRGAGIPLRNAKLADIEQLSAIHNGFI